MTTNRLVVILLWLRACLGGVKQITLAYMQSYAMLQPRHPGVHFLKIIEWLLRS